MCLCVYACLTVCLFVSYYPTIVPVEWLRGRLSRLAQDGSTRSLLYRGGGDRVC